jgi:hypothetical protein
LAQRATIKEAEAHAPNISKATTAAFVTPFMQPCITFTNSKFITCLVRVVVDPSVYAAVAFDFRCISASGTVRQLHHPPKPGEPLFPVPILLLATVFPTSQSCRCIFKNQKCEQDKASST